MNDIARQYEVLVDKLVAQLQQLAGNALLRHHRLGKLVHEFMSSLDSGHYGRGAGIQQLADDLLARGVLLDIKTPVRLLYYTAALFNLHAEDDLQTLAERGYTPSHARALMLAEPEERQALLTSARDAAGRFVSVRELVALLKPDCQVLVAELDPDPSVEPEQQPATPAIKPAKTVAARGSKATPDLGAPPADVPVTPDTPALPTPAPSTQHRAAPTIGAAFSKPLIKTLDSFQSMLDKLKDRQADVAIAVLECGKIGLSPPHFQTKVHDKLREIRSQITANVEMLVALERSIDSELTSHASQ